MLAQCAPLADALDAAQGGSAHAQAMQAARAALADPQTLPSARVLATMQRDFEGNYTAFVRAQAEQARNHLLALPWTAEQQRAFETEAAQSLAARKAVEAADTVDFESWRVAYLAPERLRV